MSRLCVLLALVALAYGRATPEYSRSNGVCNLIYCECSKAIHPAWTSINCTVPADTKMDILNLDLPSTVMELTIQGADAVMFGPGAFNSATDLRRIRISDSKIVLFRQFAAVEISVLNLYLDVEKCDILRFEKQSFHNLRGPMSVTITDCRAVTVEGGTFSWLLNIEISNVHELSLGSGSFSLDPTAANVGDHGPGMSIELKNTTIPEFAKSTFGSSAARVYLGGVNIHAIRTGAFSANTYNVVMAINCSIHLIEEEAFSENSLINYLNLNGCQMQQLSSRALRSAIANIIINDTKFDHIETGAINTTVASVKIVNSEFHTFREKGFEFYSWNMLQMENNSFDELPSNAIAAPGASIHKLIFKNNEIETMHPESLSFIGKAGNTPEIEYKNNYYGQSCHCNVSHWLAKSLATGTSDRYDSQSYCTVNEVLARCFNVPDQNMLMKKFLSEVCTQNPSIKCETLTWKSDGTIVEIKNPRFPHKNKSDELSARNKKVIGIVIVSCLGFFAVAILFSLYKWWRRGRGVCDGLKALFNSMNTSCGLMCGRLCTCGPNVGIDNARSISQMSVNEYSERHRLNESRAQDFVQESSFQNEVPQVAVTPHVPVTPREPVTPNVPVALDVPVAPDEPVAPDLPVVPVVPAVPVTTAEKHTQTLPEQLTPELLANLKERLDNPDNYVEAREMIEHLYELTKMTYETPQIPSAGENSGENIYELPYQNATSDLACGGPKETVSIGTNTPSLDKLTPLSPYNRQTALSHDYFEPTDMAVHLYAEIANNDRENHTSVFGAIPDVIAEQAGPRGPYLRALLSPNSSSSPSPAKSSTSTDLSSDDSPRYKKLINKSGNKPGRMINRPLPEMPQGGRGRANLGEGASLRLG